MTHTEHNQTPLSSLSIGFIGAGNMAAALAKGLIQQKHPASHIWMSAPSDRHLEPLKQDLRIQTTHHNQEVCNQCNTIILAVKPQVMGQTLSTLDFSNVDCVISVAAGISLKQLSRHIDHSQITLIRAMPNTPALENCGMTGLITHDNHNTNHHAHANYIFNAVGKTLWFNDENHMDIVTALSGSSPAYFLLMMQALIESGIHQGLDPSNAKTLVIQSALGAATLMDHHPDVDIHDRLDQITSPGGTTEAALNVFKQNQFNTVVDNVVQAAVQRGKDLSRAQEQ